MQVKTIINGNVQLILKPENDMEKEILKKLNHASVSVIAQGNSIMTESIEGSLLIKEENAKKQS